MNVRRISKAFGEGKKIAFFKKDLTNHRLIFVENGLVDHFFQSGPKTLNSIQPVNFTSDFWLRIEDIFPHTPPSSLNSLSSSSTVGQPFFCPRRCCCFFWGSEKTTHKGGLFFSAKSKVPRSENFQWSGSLPFLQVLQNNFFWR